ncbi:MULTISPECIES: hypothetical protein [Streptomyces]|uniref:Uncharacterized protein n=1 Tax=Streptomyces alanosinicus TaxID=68171 RepID=A0A919D4X9_9ACTN|nr:MULTISPECIES: hypothetical protein [Streptomyces]GHE08547.1 hypothetical protein GCM10010339_57720 [Streptomyces alanosinicus]
MRYGIARKVEQVPLRHEPDTAVVRVLTGADEAALGAPDLHVDEQWVTRVLSAAVEEVGGSLPSVDRLRALCIGDRNALLLAVVAVTYGAPIEWMVACPSCGEQLDAAVDVQELIRDAGEPGARADGQIGYRLPTGADLEAVVAIADAGQGRHLLLDRCVDGWRTLGEEALTAVEASMAAADPLADIELLLHCASCTAAVPGLLDPAAELAARLATPHELLEDVHTLALAYGWTESDVLALPAPRRAEYLTLIADGGV